MQQKLALKEQCEGEWFLHEHDILEKKKHLDTKISNHFIQPKVRCHSQIMTSSADLTVAKKKLLMDCFLPSGNFMKCLKVDH